MAEGDARRQRAAATAARTAADVHQTHTLALRLQVLGASAAATADHASCGAAARRGIVPHERALQPLSNRMDCQPALPRAPVVTACAEAEGVGGEDEEMMVDDERMGGAAPVAEAAAAPSPVAAFGSTGGGRSAVADAPLAHAPLTLERDTGTVLSVYWPQEGKAFRGEVRYTSLHAKHGVEGVVVLYADGERWHDFGAHDGHCTFTVLEPPLPKIAMMRRTTGNHLEGILPSPNDGTIYSLNAEDVEAHFSDPEINERAWLDALRGNFLHVPAAGKKKASKKASVTKALAASPKKPDCVPGSLTRAFTAAGDAEAVEIISAHADAIITAEWRKGDRFKHAANDVVGPLCHYYVRSLKKVSCALAVDPEYVTLLQLKSSDGTIRSHAVTVFGGRLFDSAEPEPLQLTSENLTRCLGAEYGGIVRGYYFVAQPKAAERIKRARTDDDAPLAKKARA